MRPAGYCNLKIPKRLYLDFAPSSWYLSGRSGSVCLRRNPVARLVLVADDSPTIQKRAQWILKGEGFDVETVSNGVAAIKRLAVLQPVLVLADVSMPGRDGYEVCEFIKRSSQLSHVPVLLVASDMEPYDEARGAQVGADGRITKPFEPQDLISMVEKFAALSAAAANPTVVASVPAPPAPEPVPEFQVGSFETKAPPAEERPAAPVFSPIFEEVPFAEPLAAEAPHNEETAAAVEPTTSVAPAQPEEPVAPLPEVPTDLAELFAAPELATSSAAETLQPSDTSAVPVLEEPVFVEEEAEPPVARPAGHDHPHDLHSHAPAESAEPVWRDETFAPPASPEVDEAVAPAPQLEVAPQGEAPAVPAAETVEPVPSEAAPETSGLESFSLEEPTDQAPFSSGETNFSSAATTEETPTEPAAETVAEAPVEHAGESFAEMTNETAAEPASESLADIFAAGPIEGLMEPAAEAAIEPPAEPIATESVEAPGEPPAEEVVPEPPAELVAEIPAEPLTPAPPEAPINLSAEEPAVAPAEEVPAEVPAQPMVESAAAAEPVADALPTEPPVEPRVEIPSEPESLTPPVSPAAIDWDLLYLIVHKIVLKMSPPALRHEAVEELARKLTDETAFELSVEPPPREP